MVKHFPLPKLLVWKLSYPCRDAQGGTMQRYMHGGQQYVRLLNVELNEP